MLTKREEVIKVLGYKSGEDSCNSVYVGCLATSKVCAMLGVPYGSGKMHHALRQADLRTIHRIHKYLYPGYIKYMRENPVTKCPHCGQITPVKED